MRDFNLDGMVVGRLYQEIQKRSAVQAYPIGTIHERHGKRFRYCRACANVTITHVGLPNMSLHGGDTGGGVYGCMGTVGNKGYEGETHFLMANVANANPQTLFTKDWFYNGTLNLYVPHADYTDVLTLRISGSDVAIAASVKLYLDEPLPCDVAATVFGECHPSPYLNVGANNSGGANYPFVVVNQVELTTGDYFWGQTRGPCYVQRNVGVDTSARRKVFISGLIEDEASNDIRQQVGYALTPKVSDGMVMLMLE